MGEVLKLISEIEKNLSDNDIRKMKLMQHRLLIIAALDTAMLINKSDFEGVERVMRKLREGLTQIRSKYVDRRFAPGGFVTPKKGIH